MKNILIATFCIFTLFGCADFIQGGRLAILKQTTTPLHTYILVLFDGMSDCKLNERNENDDLMTLKSIKGVLSFIEVNQEYDPMRSCTKHLIEISKNIKQTDEEIRLRNSFPAFQNSVLNISTLIKSKAAYSVKSTGDKNFKLVVKNNRPKF